MEQPVPRITNTTLKLCVHAKVVANATAKSTKTRMQIVATYCRLESVNMRKYAVLGPREKHYVHNVACVKL